MLDFKPLSPADSSWLQPILCRTPRLTCESSLCCMTAWGFGSIAACGDFYVPMVTNEGISFYLPPLGGEDYSAILPALLEDSHERGIPFRLFGVTAQDKAWLETQGRFEFAANRDFFDYLYEIEALCNLSGHKHQAKRNHINRFTEEYPDWRSEPITTETLPECRDMADEWYREHFAAGVDPADFDWERRAFAYSLDHYGEFGFDGLLIRAGWRVVAFSLGAPLSETVYDVNFEKAFSSVTGAYTIINREFARMVHERYPSICLLDREDDMGVEGLRSAKLSYHPAEIQEKYLVTLKEDPHAAG